MSNYREQTEATNMMRDRETERSTHKETSNRHIEPGHPGTQRYRGDVGSMGNTPEGTRMNVGIYAAHRGKGPRNYKRSDQRIREIVCDLLCDDPYLDASNIEVEVKNGDVIMTGWVEHRYAKRLAEDIVEIVSGVANVENRIHVNEEGMYLQGQERVRP